MQNQKPVILLLLVIVVVIAGFLFRQPIESIFHEQHEPSPLRAKVTYQQVFPDLSFTNPTGILQQADTPGRWYVTEKSGKIYYFSDVAGISAKTLYLDISDSQVDESFEGGLLGMAFAPDFSQSRQVYLSYTSSENPAEDNSKTLESRISRFTVNDANTAIDPASEIILFRLEQPWNNHNGGHIVFGPDGFLYAGYGDGGSWGDPNDSAQNVDRLLGKILRLDVTPKSDDESHAPYRIPSDNPFVASDACSSQRGCPEIYAWGFRNPWRWSFDRQTGQLWVGDVGQGAWEEVNLVKKGGNYGWRCFEGEKEYNFKNCQQNRVYEMPVSSYRHSDLEEANDGAAASVTGGYVYRGADIPELFGHYIFADFVHGVVRVIEQPYAENPETGILFDSDLQIVSFAEDLAGELYFLNYSESGGIYKFVPKH